MIKNLTIAKSYNMAQEISKTISISDALFDAIAQTPRESFVPIGFVHLAYKLDALPLSSAQWISSPLTVAKMTEAMCIDKSVDSVLEVGCGSGYQAAILSQMVRRVFTVERISTLLLESKQRFKDLGLSNIHARCDDGQNGWRSYAPFDRILYSAYTSQIPQKLFSQLKNGGVLVAPIEKDSKQYITQFFKKENGEIEQKILDECIFVPIKDGVERV